VWHDLICMSVFTGRQRHAGITSFDRMAKGSYAVRILRSASEQGRCFFRGGKTGDPNFWCGETDRDVDRFVAQRRDDAPLGPKHPPFTKEGPIDFQVALAFCKDFDFNERTNLLGADCCYLRYLVKDLPKRSMRASFSH
jgi:hypothetical protein